MEKNQNDEHTQNLPTLSSSAPPLPHKLKSRREVIDWLSTLVSASKCNSATLTFDGVDLMGERLAEEVFSIIKRE